MKDIMGMMKQAQQLQARMQQMQEELGSAEVEGRSGAGLVRVTLDGKGSMKRVHIDPSLMRADETEILEDLILAACQDAKGKVEKLMTEKMKDATGGRGVNVILDMVGGDYVERNIRCAADDGRIVNIAYQKGSKVSLDLIRVMLKRLTLTGSTLRIRSTAVKAAIARNVETHALPLFADGRVRVVIDQTFPLADAADAHRRIEAGTHIGKIVLVVGEQA